MVELPKSFDMTDADKVVLLAPTPDEDGTYCGANACDAQGKMVNETNSMLRISFRDFRFPTQTTQTRGEGAVQSRPSCVEPQEDSLGAIVRRGNNLPRGRQQSVAHSDDANHYYWKLHMTRTMLPTRRQLHCCGSLFLHEVLLS